MGFKLPKGCREYFGNILDRNNETMLPTLFDEYYLCLMVGFAQCKIDAEAELEAEFLDNFIIDYQESKEYIIGLFFATEVKRLDIDIKNADELELHLKKLVGINTKTHLTENGEELLNQYAAYGYNFMREKMLGTPHIKLEEFYDDYFSKYSDGTFFEM